MFGRRICKNLVYNLAIMTIGIILIIIGVAICSLWALDVQRGKKNMVYLRAAHYEPLGGCLPYMIGIGLIILGIFLLF
jgi:uncharacterized membrane protein YidH (DUF202 family)